MIPPDIEERILTALQSIFNYELVQQNNNHTTALRVLKQAPLQDDPTVVAPYLVYEKDPKKPTKRMTHEECKEYGEAEIGGPLRYVLHFHAKMGTPIAATREVAQQYINQLMSLTMNTLVKYYDLAGVNAPGSLWSPDMSRYIEGANEYLIDESETHIYGGETTWYGEGDIWWHYPVSWYVQVRFNQNG